MDNGDQTLPTVSIFCARGNIALRRNTRSILKAVNYRGNGLEIVLSGRIQLRTHIVSFDPQPKLLFQPCLRSSSESSRKSIVAKRRARKNVGTAGEGVRKRL